ncbi:MAG TPA: TAXI family TRAP transporter solute-binding subunit [Xanthobacteraceae bacterium]|nr:TAXI family TRAP transporter solute-binding subunit [Xanthobacteraceae bacterium]
MRTAAARVDARTIGERMNANTLIVVTASPNLIFTAFGADLATVLNDGDELRILPVITEGAVQNMRDVRFLRGVDLGFTTANLLGYFRRTGEIGDMENKLTYISTLGINEFHFLARHDIKSIEQLRGQKVNFGAKGSGVQISARDVFARINLPVEEVNMAPADGFEKVKRGEIAATVVISGKPSAALVPLKASDGYHLLPVPYSKPLQDGYLPSVLTNAEYPNLIAPGEQVETIAASSMLIAYNWPKNTDRYRRIEKFVNAFFTKFAEFQKPPRHPQWKNVNLASTVPGWKRFPAAEEWLARYREEVLSNRRKQFDEYLADRTAGRPISERDRNQLFEDFLKWSQARENR